MLSLPVMAAVALAALWLNMLLISIDLLMLRYRLGVRLNGLSDLECGTVDRADDVLATHRVLQTGYAVRGAGRVIGFEDGPAVCEVHGGVLRVGTSQLRVESAAGEGVEVWPDRQRQTATAACPSRDDFDSAWTAASSSRGWSREVNTPVSVGDTVWVRGQRVGQSVRGGEQGLLVCAYDPRPVLIRQRGRLLYYALGVLVAAALATLLCLQPPAFGPVSIAGAMLGIALFLGAPPLLKVVRDGVLPGSHIPIRGQWTIPG